jgi:hypothetical protein
MVKKNILIIFIIGLSLFFYLKTLMPSVGFSDVGELQAVSCTLGIAHPPGYPLYVILGKIFSFLPIGLVAWRINFMSAFFSTAALVLFFLIGERIYHSLTTAFLTTFILAFSQNFWHFSLLAEMYSLNMFLTLLFLYLVLFLFSSKKQRDKKYFFFFFLLGLAQGNHRCLTLIAPFLVGYLFLENKKIFLNLKQLLKMTAFFILGLSIYLYLPLRSRQNPYLNYGRPTTWQNFKYLVLAEQFRFLMFTVPLKKVFTARMMMFVQLLNEQFFVFGLFLALLGLVWFFKQKKYKPLLLLLLIFFTNTLVWLAYNTDDIYRYLTPSFTVTALLIGGGIEFLISLIRQIRLIQLRTLLHIFLTLCYLLFTLYLTKVNYPKVDLSQDFSAYNWGINFMSRLKKNAVVISHWGYSPAMWYLQGCEGLRPDILIADDRVIDDEGWGNRVQTIKHFISKRPVYVIPYQPYINQIKEAGFKIKEQDGVDEIVSL